MPSRSRGKRSVLRKFAGTTALIALAIVLMSAPATAAVTGEQQICRKIAAEDPTANMSPKLVRARLKQIDEDAKTLQKGRVGSLRIAAKQYRQEFTGVYSLLDACAAAFPNDRTLARPREGEQVRARTGACWETPSGM